MPKNSIGNYLCTKVTPRFQIESTGILHNSVPGLTQTRVRLTLSQKVKIIEESKKSDFSRKKICEEYSISKATISSILKDQKTHLENYERHYCLFQTSELI